MTRPLKRPNCESSFLRRVSGPTCWTKQQRLEKEVKVRRDREDDSQTAISVLLDKKLSQAAAARKFSVPRTTLVDRLHGRKSRGEAQASRQLLSFEEEARLVNFWR